MSFLKKLYTKIIVICMLLPQYVYADGLLIDLPTTNFNDVKVSSSFQTIFSNFIQLLETILNILVGLGILSSVAAGIYLAIKYAMESDDKILISVRKNCLVVFGTTATFAAVRLLLFIIIMLLSIFN